MSCCTDDQLLALADTPDAPELSDAAAHAAGCSDCGARLARLTATARQLRDLPQVTDGRFAMEVIERLGRPRGWSLAWPAVGGLVAAAAAAVLFLQSPVVEPPPAPGAPGVLTARGGEVEADRSRKLGVGVRLASDPRRELPTGATLPPTDGLVFEVRNRTGAATTVMIFGLDARGDVHWFYPAWLTEETDPASVPVAAKPALTVLSEAVAPADPAEGTFIVAAVFHPVALHVKATEAVLANGGLDALQSAHPRAIIQTHDLIIGGGR